MADVSSHSTPDSVEPNPNFIKWLKQNCVPILGLVSGALVLCLVGHYGSTTVDWTKTKDFTEAFVNVTQSLALIAAGLWAYFKFAKGRTFRDRLTPSVSGKFVSIDDSVFLVVTMQLKNVGLSRIAFDQEASSLYVFGYVPVEGSEILRVDNSLLASFRVFGDTDRYIEPNEVVERQTLIALTRVSSVGYELEVKVLSDSGCVWRATTIVDKSAVAHNEKGKPTRIGEKRNEVE
jgi:hypothetical protein